MASGWLGALQGGGGGGGSTPGAMGLQAASAAGQTAFSWGLNAKSASVAWDRWKKSQIRGPKYAVMGLRRAGLNPVLAAGASGFGGMKAPSAPQAAAAHPASVGDPLVFEQGALLRDQRDLTQQQTATASALEQKYKADSGFVSRQTYIAGLTLNEKEELSRFYGTAEGQALARALQLSGATPKTFAEGLTRGAMLLGSDASVREEVSRILKSVPAHLRAVISDLLYGRDSDKDSSDAR